MYSLKRIYFHPSGQHWEYGTRVEDQAEVETRSQLRKYIADYIDSHPGEEVNFYIREHEPVYGGGYWESITDSPEDWL